jgi:hypothetical protein
MAKKSAYIAEAERLYVVEHLTLEEISARLSGNVSVRTLQTWKTEGDWENRRRQLTQQQSLFSEDLYALCRKLMKSIENDIENDREPSQGKLYTFTRLTDSLRKTKQYEDALTENPADTQQEKPPMSPEEFIKLFRKGLFDE